MTSPTDRFPSRRPAFRPLLLILLFAALISSAIASPPTERRIYVFDLWKFFEREKIDQTADRADFLYFITALQGMANRESPRLYLLASLSLFDLEIRSPAARKEDLSVTDLDEFWLSYLVASKDVDPESLVRTASLSEILDAFRDRVKGTAVWEMKVPATVNAALAAASTRDLLPVSADLGAGRLRAWLGEHAPGLAPRLDFTGRFLPVPKGTPVSVHGVEFPSSGSPKPDVYHYIRKAFLETGEASPAHFSYNSDAAMWGPRRRMYSPDVYGHLGDRNELQQNGAFNGDYWVAKRGLFIDLYVWDDQAPDDDPGQPVGADLEAFHALLEASYRRREGEFGIVGGFVPWWIKYVDARHEGVPTEWRFIELITSYNLGNDADAAFGLSNASFFMHLRAIGRDRIPRPPQTFPALSPDTTYLAFFMLDYDGSAWLNQAAEAVYEAGGRGRVALNWSVNPVLNERVPHAYRYMVENRTALDHFGIEDDGVSYISPYRLTAGARLGRIQDSGISFYERYARSYHERFGIEITAFYITPRYDAGWGEMAARLTPRGFGINIPVPESQVQGTPIVTLPHFHVHQAQDFVRFIEDVHRDNQLGRPERKAFLPLRCILMPPHVIADAMDAARKKYPEAKVEAVDAFTFFHLRKEWLSRSPRP